MSVKILRLGVDFITKLNRITEPKVLICTGFHRSATSAVSLQLGKSGLPMGTRLMIGHISNPLGHGEDVGLAELHEKYLQEAGTSWQFHDEVPLTQIDSARIHRYISLRDNALMNSNCPPSAWGGKDPRACLYLDHWLEALGDRGCFLFVLRHWSESLESLYNRHSRELAYSLNEIGINNYELRFWLQPELAARMWLAYCRRMLAFARENKQKCLLVTQRAFMQGAPIVRELNQRFSFDLDDSAESIIDDSIIGDSPCPTMIESLSITLRLQLDEVWQSLLSLSDFQADDEYPQIAESKKCSSSFDARYRAACKDLISQPEFGLKNNMDMQSEQKRFSLLRLKLEESSSEREVINTLNHSEEPFQFDSEEQLLQIIYELNTKFPFSGEIRLCNARFLKKNKCWQAAFEEYRYALVLGYTAPHIFMEIGQCHHELGDNEKALQSFEQALNKNPNNPNFYIAKAKLLRELGDNPHALELLEKAYQISPNEPHIVVMYSEMLLQKDQTDRALEILGILLNATYDYWAEQMKARILLRLNPRSGKISYLSDVAKNIEHKDFFGWLSLTSTMISSKTAENDFILRIEKHWNNAGLNVTN
ncbi:tetratricopeptide repeat protein [Marinomonas shanghaiensis]|uniref:tetratricopeptide repeat protein n=1 Tax=Marinomonas shanghaiensis TaxID=2202418 RepID=UPI003A9437E7